MCVNWVFSLNKQTHGSFRFNLCPIVHQMSEADWRTAIYCKFHVHGLSVKPLPLEKYHYDLKCLDSLVNTKRIKQQVNM